MTVLCKDCGHALLADNHNTMCDHESTRSPVDGISGMVSALAMRNEISKCGPEGRWFKPVPRTGINAPLASKPPVE